MKRLFLLCSLRFCAMICSLAHAADSPFIKIVSSLPRTGSATARSTTLVNGIRMAIDEAGGKIGDFTLPMKTGTTLLPSVVNGTLAVEAPERAESRPRPRHHGLHRHRTTPVPRKSPMPILNEASLLMVSPATRTPVLTKPGSVKPMNPVYRPSQAKSIFSALSPPTTSRAKSPRNGPRNSA